MKRYYSLFLMLVLTLPLAVGFLLPSATSPHSEVVLADDDPFLRGPTVELVTNATATIFWKTNYTSDATVQYGTTESLGSSVSNATISSTHFVRLSGLTEDTRYYYKAISESDESPIYHFRTAPVEGDAVKVIIAGDNRPDSTEAPNQPEIFSDIADMIIEEEPHIVILTGDFVYKITGYDAISTEGWKHFNAIRDRMGHYAPVIGVLGNHDTGAATGTMYLDYYLASFINAGTNTTYFSYDYSGIHILVLDSEVQGSEGEIQGAQLTWLENDLDSTDKEIIFAFAHRPLYPIKHIGSSMDVDPEKRTALQNLFEEHDVTLFACGHDHAYNSMIVNGVLHLITGGAGAPLYNSPWGGAYHHYVVANVNSSGVDLDVIDTDDETRDEFSLPYEGPIIVYLRVVANGTTKSAGTMPEVYFSSVPETVFYSWDSDFNETELTGIPEEPGQHSLDVYAEDKDGLWTHVHYIFSTRSTTTEITETTDSADLLLPVIIIGAAAVVVILVVVIKRKK